MLFTSNNKHIILFKRKDVVVVEGDYQIGDDGKGAADNKILLLLLLLL